MRVLIFLLLFGGPAVAMDRCRGVDPKVAISFGKDVKSVGCRVHMSLTGYPLPDPECTPGATNPTVTTKVLRSPIWRTSCVRNGATSSAQKRSIYAAYGIVSPAHNVGKTQTCELDHLVPIESGGSDTLENIWPQCGPAKAPLSKRWFKVKDQVENYVTREIKGGRISLEDAQRGIAEDWSQYVPVVLKHK